MIQVFVDTSALMALLDADDPRQGSVRDAFADHRADHLVTHGYVVAESLAVARRRLGVEGAVALLDEVLPSITVLPVDLALHTVALSRYRASLPSAVSFVDQVSFAVMSEASIRTAIALDADFVGAGITVVPAP